MSPLTLVDINALLTTATGDRLEALWWVLLGLGLRWEDVHLDRGWVQVRRTLGRVRTDELTPGGQRRGRLTEAPTKTTASTAPLALPGIVSEALRAHRVRQDAERATARVWVDPRLVFATSVGTPLEPRNVNRSWEVLCARPGVRRLRVHDLRHATASFLLVAGIDIKVVQTMLRHARLATTADTYTHVLAEVQRDAADQFDTLLRKAVLSDRADTPPDTAA